MQSWATYTQQQAARCLRLALSACPSPLWSRARPVVSKLYWDTKRVGGSKQLGSSKKQYSGC